MVLRDQMQGKEEINYLPILRTAEANLLGQKCEQASPIRVRRLLVDNAPAANKDARKCENRRYKTCDGPRCLGKPVKPSKMQLREPGQALVGNAVGGIQQEQDCEPLWERKIDSRGSPQQNEEDEPESKRAVQVPIDARKLRSPADGQASTPILHPWPPDEGSCQPQKR